MTEARCPRCACPLGVCPGHPRLTTERDVRVCMPCGTDEAVREMDRLPPIPFDELPIS